jgi:hypothetical protein
MASDGRKMGHTPQVALNDLVEKMRAHVDHG